MMITKVGRQLATDLGLGSHEDDTLCSLLHRLAKSYARIQEAWCSVEMLPHVEEALRVRESKLESRIRKTVKALNLKRVKFTGDPRGFTVRVFRADGKFNTWGGADEGWGIA